MKYPHWEYFVALCDDFEGVTRYVEPDADNFNTYSIEFVRLYLAIGSEVDVVAKVLCAKLDSTAKCDGINSYRAVILNAYRDVPDVKVIVPRNGLTLTPWSEWRTGKNPKWWTAYNSVKHERNAAFKDACLGNTLNALGGLLVLVGYLYAEDLALSRFFSTPNFVRFDKQHWCGSSLGEHGYMTGYLLPGVPKPKR